MSDGHEKKAIEPTGERKKRGPKPRGRVAMTAVQRKREQRCRHATSIYEKDASQWTESACLWVLAGAKWRGTLMDEAAWRQLGKLRGFA